MTPQHFIGYKRWSVWWQFQIEKTYQNHNSLDYNAEKFQPIGMKNNLPYPMSRNVFIIISKVLWRSPKGNFTGNSKDIYPWYEFENISMILQVHLGGTAEFMQETRLIMDGQLVGHREGGDNVCTTHSSKDASWYLFLFRGEFTAPSGKRLTGIWSLKLNL